MRLCARVSLPVASTPPHRPFVVARARAYPAARTPESARQGRAGGEVEKALAQRSNGHQRPSANTKLAFVEALLATDTLVEASQLAVEWLARHLGVRQVAVALVDLERTAG